MKSVICAVVILVLIVGGGVISTNALENFSDELCALNDSVYTLSMSGSFDEAWKKLDEIDELLEEKKLLIASTVDHLVFERIEQNLRCLRVYVGERTDLQIKAYCSILDCQIRMLPEDYKLRAENIL